MTPQDASPLFEPADPRRHARRARKAASVAAALSLIGAASTAVGDGEVAAKVPSPDCGASGTLADGTPCVLQTAECPPELALPDGRPCVPAATPPAADQPVAMNVVEPPAKPEPTPEPEPAPAPEAAPEQLEAGGDDRQHTSERPAPQQDPGGGQPAPEPDAAAPVEPAQPVEPVKPRKPKSARKPPRAIVVAGADAGAAPESVAKPKGRGPRRAKAHELVRSKAERVRHEVGGGPSEGLELVTAGPVAQAAVHAPLALPEEAPRIPAYLLPYYRAAGAKHGVPWQILAAINEIETDFGRILGPSPAGAVGWMQFMPSTWKAYGVDADGDGRRDPNSPRDAIFAAARYLEAAGAEDDLRKAIFAYNHANWYVEAVLMRAAAIGPKDPVLDELVATSGEDLQRRVLENPDISIYECGRQDIASGIVDRRVLVTLEFLAKVGLHPTVTSLRCGHGVYTASGNVSEHFTGSAVDIAAFNGVSVLGNQGPGSLAEQAVRELIGFKGAMKPHQIISLMRFTGPDNTVAMSDHHDHVHIGFRPRATRFRATLVARAQRNLKNALELR